METWQVILFIEEFKKACKERRYYITQREKNMNFLEKIGWTVDNMLDFLEKNLSHKYYYRGPEAEKDPKFVQGTVFAFNIPIHDYKLEELPPKIYVKIKKVEEEDYFVILSFHEGGK
ncbi:MAG: hypothetical protein ABFC87_04835 [Fervidobacterium sp.]